MLEAHPHRLEEFIRYCRYKLIWIESHKASPPCLIGCTTTVKETSPENQSLGHESRGDPILPAYKVDRYGIVPVEDIFRIVRNSPTERNPAKRTEPSVATRTSSRFG